MYRRNRRIASGVAVLLALGFWGWFLWPKASLSASAATSGARKLTASGRYDEAIREIDDHLRQSPGNKDWSALKDEIDKEMTVSLRLHYLRGNKLPVQKADRGKLTLSPSDTYYYVVDPSESCNLYLFEIGSSGELAQIFPNRAYSSAKNPVPPGRQQVPSGPQGLRSKDRAGEERVIVVAARWEMPELEQLAKAASAQTDPAKRRSALARLLARIDNEKQYAPQLGGLGFGEASFHNSGAAGRQ
jgi:hypothetical protein